MASGAFSDEKRAARGQRIPQSAAVTHALSLAELFARVTAPAFRKGLARDDRFSPNVFGHPKRRYLADYLCSDCLFDFHNGYLFSLFLSIVGCLVPSQPRSREGLTKVLPWI